MALEHSREDMKAWAMRLLRKALLILIPNSWVSNMACLTLMLPTLPAHVRDLKAEQETTMPSKIGVLGSKAFRWDHEPLAISQPFLHVKDDQSLTTILDLDIYIY